MRYVCAWMREIGIGRGWECNGLFRDDAATRIGAGLAVLNMCLLVCNIMVPAGYGRDPHNGLPVLNAGMALLQQPMDTTAFLVILVACACWLQIRFRATLLECGYGVMKIAFLASAPTVAAGVLILAKVLGVIVLGPGEAPTTFLQHGFAVTYYSARTHPPAAWLQMLLVLFRVWEAFFWGVLGGLLGRGITDPARRSSPQPA